MSPELRTAYEAELSRVSDQTTPEAWTALERAHVLSQAYALAHTYVHWRMLRFAIRNGDAGEILGQLARLLLAAPGSLLGRAPVGNTGGANVGIFSPMEIPMDLRAILTTDPRSSLMIGERRRV